MRAFQVMPGHRFVDRQQMDHAVVVFAQERFGLLRGPVIGDRRDRVIGVEPLVERAGRIAIRDRHAALELGHQDDLDRIVRHGDEVMLAHEVGGGRERLLGERDDLIARRALGIGELERRLDRGLLLRRAGIGR